MADPTDPATPGGRFAGIDRNMINELPLDTRPPATPEERLQREQRWMKFFRDIKTRFQGDAQFRAQMAALGGGLSQSTPPGLTGADVVGNALVASEAARGGVQQQENELAQQAEEQRLKGEEITQQGIIARNRNATLRQIAAGREAGEQARHAETIGLQRTAEERRIQESKERAATATARFEQERREAQDREDRANQRFAIQMQRMTEQIEEARQRGEDLQKKLDRQQELAIKHAEERMANVNTTARASIITEALKTNVDKFGGGLDVQGFLDSVALGLNELGQPGGLLGGDVDLQAGRRPFKDWVATVKGRIENGDKIDGVTVTNQNAAAAALELYPEMREQIIQEFGVDPGEPRARAPSGPPPENIQGPPVPDPFEEGLAGFPERGPAGQPSALQRLQELETRVFAEQPIAASAELGRIHRPGLTPRPPEGMTVEELEADVLRLREELRGQGVDDRLVALARQVGRIKAAQPAEPTPEEEGNPALEAARRIQRTREFFEGKF